MAKRVSIGRGEDNDFVINLPVVSGHHAVATMIDKNSFTIEDLGSTNGTFVNGNKVKKAEVTLKDRIKVGNAEISLAKIFGLQPVAPQAEPSPAEKIPNDFRVEFARLGQLYSDYETKRREIQKKYNSNALIIRFVVSIALGFLAYLVTKELGDDTIRIIISSGTMAVTMGLSSFAANSPKKEEELKKLRIELYRNYICPNPKCKMQLGDKEWQLWALNHTCPRCGAIWSD